MQYVCQYKCASMRQVLLDKKKISYLLLLAENKKKPSVRKLLSMTL